jgi:23S rRNA U2552 (ribose-2'-O)-methylase RlmE/FtsJ
MYLIELAVDLASQVLKPGGAFLTKVFHGEGFDELLKQMKGSTARSVRANRKPRVPVHAKFICWRKALKGKVDRKP